MDSELSNHDRLLAFLYDSKYVRRDALTDLATKQLSFYMTTYDNEKLIYHGNGGEKATLYVFTLKGRFKYSIHVDIPGAASSRKNDSKSRLIQSLFPRRTDSAARSVEPSGDGAKVTQPLHDSNANIPNPVDQNLQLGDWLSDGRE